MTEFINPNDFRDEDELFDYILEHVVKPKLQEALGTDEPMDQVSGTVYVFGGRGGIDPEIFTRLQHHIQDGLNLEYVLRELCDLQVRSTRESQVGELCVRYVELMEGDGETEALSVEELETMYRLS